MEKRSATSLCKSLAKGGQSTLVTKKSTDEDEDFISGYPWPPRSYSCTFCDREFKSAQALGGHMNVHRKDRARLRCSPPRRMPSDIIGQYTRSTLINLNLKPNPNPNRPSLPSSPSPLPSWINSQASHSPLASSSKSPTFHCENMKLVVGGKLLSRPLKMETLDLTKQMKMDTNSPEDGGMMLDLETGVLGGCSKENIDLELRLGYSS